jgi:hypothetical protein
MVTLVDSNLFDDQASQSEDVTLHPKRCRSNDHVATVVTYSHRSIAQSHFTLAVIELGTILNSTEDALGDSIGLYT